MNEGSRIAAGLLCLVLAVPALGQPSQLDRKEFARVKASADKGSAEAQFKLGMMYANGVGVKQDPEKAAKWHRKAAEQGLPRAQYQLGLDYADGQGVKSDDFEAVQWYRKAAEAGLPEAQYELGMCCLSGRGTKESGLEALDWFHKAADQNFPVADYQIGMCYFEGRGAAKDIEEGIRWIQSAAEKGVPLAQSKFGMCFEKGEGVAKDKVQAYKWYALAASRDDQRALEIKVTLAKLEAELTKDQVALAQKLAREFKPGQAGKPNSAPTPAAVSQPQPSSGIGASGTADTAWVNVSTTEADCEIFLDGGFVGNSPAKLKLPEGTHVVEVKKTGFQVYRREIKIVPGSDLTLNPVLQRH